MADFEMVVPNSANRYDEFVEYLDQQIKFSNLKRVIRLGRASWDISGGFLSKGRAQIYLRGNDIICRINTEVEIFPIILIIILTALIGLIILVIALDNQKRIEREVRRAIESAKTQILVRAPKKPVKIRVEDREKFMDCPGCGKTLYEEANFCPYCGFKMDRCIVCNRFLGKGKITKCPYCSGLAHRDHLLEYVKVKGQCPACGKELKIHELV